MRKRVRKKESKGDCKSDDWISQLPDDILVSILSHLSLKNAVATSLLSRKWRYLWTCIVGMDFEGTPALDRIAAEPRLLRVERSKYINWVNRVVGKHRGVVIEEFKICFDLNKSSKSAIDRWVKFAIGKKVRKLELDLLETGGALRQASQNYVFPYKLLTQNKRPSLKRSCSKFRSMEPSTLLGLKFLKDLSLKSVTVGEEALANILSNCPALESLSMHGSVGLVNVRINGPSLTLRFLEIVFCSGIESIEICHTNLVTFSYLGPAINLLLKNLPMLDEISIGEGLSGLENNVFGQISYCLHQLKVLTLDVYHPEENMKLLDVPEFPKLEELTIKVGVWDDDSLLGLTSLIEACPYLENFMLQLIWVTPSKKRRRVKQAAKIPHQHLKLVEIVGYYGRTSDAELALYFLQNAVALQKIVIDLRNLLMERAPVENDEIKRQEAARTRAKRQLEAKRPPGVKLVIL